MRNRTLKRFKVWALIRILPFPKVHIRTSFRLDGSYTVDFGMRSHDYLVSKGLYWDKDGNYICKEKVAFWCGQDYAINSMWVYIMRAHIEGMINEMDYVKS